MFRFRSEVHREGIYKQDLDPLNKENPSPSDVLVTIGDFKYTYGEFKKRLEEENQDITQMLPEDREEWFHRVLDEFYFAEVAKAKGFQDTPRYKAIVKFQKDAELITRYLKKKLEDVTSSNRDLKSFYDNNLKSFQHLIERHLKLILVKANLPEKADRAQRHYAFLAAKKHYKAVDTYTQPSRRRHTVLQRADKILIHPVRLLIAAMPFGQLCFKPFFLIQRIAKLGKGVRNLQPANEGLEALR